jgi:hypothetical protein
MSNLLAFLMDELVVTGALTGRSEEGLEMCNKNVVDIPSYFGACVTILHCM